MPINAPWQAILDAIRESTGLELKNSRVLPIGGGCINEAIRVESGGREDPLFVKRNIAAKLPMFEAESEALAEIATTGTIRVPKPICHGTAAGSAFLAMEAITLGSRSDPASQEKMGRQLAALHRVTSPDGRFGWHRDNTIGEVPQINRWCESWPAFFAKYRLGFQFERASENGRPFARAAALLDRLPELLGDHDPAPSLLHGDLWGGNAGFDPEGEPVIYDPATYCGDRETDLAFTEMFGGFGSAFYAGYHAAWPLDDGYEFRRQVYNLYHVVNHHNHFGGGYASQADAIIDRLVAD